MEGPQININFIIAKLCPIACFTRHQAISPSIDMCHWLIAVDVSVSGAVLLGY
jgi:hypothetical protein